MTTLAEWINECEHNCKVIVAEQGDLITFDVDQGVKVRHYRGKGGDDEG